MFSGYLTREVTIYRRNFLGIDFSTVESYLFSLFSIGPAQYIVE
jgi:hypothetical protein